MGAIAIASPPTSPTFAGQMSSRSRFRPSLPALVFVALHAALFYYYQQRISAAASSPAAYADRGAASTPDATLHLSAALPSLATSSCEVCHLDPSNPLCEYGLDSIRQSRAYEGSGARLRRVLEKALRGEEIGVGILGASVTQGHSVTPGKPVWQYRWFADFQRLFPNSKIHVGAVGAMDSRVETDLNDDPHLESLRDNDGLMRALLQLPQDPAIMRVSVVATLFDELVRGTMSNLMTSQHFDVPVISVRNFLLPHMIFHREAAEEVFGLDAWGNRDYRHMSEVGHAALGDMLALFIRKEVCETQRRQVMPPPPSFPRTGPWPTGEDLGRIPPLALWSSWRNPKELVPISPMCQTAVSPLSPLNPHSHSSAFKMVEWNGKKAWGSNQPGSQIRFKWRGTRVGLFVWASNGRGTEEDVQDKRLRRQNAPGQALCWVEEQDVSEEDGEAKDGGLRSAPEAQSWVVNSHRPEKPAAGPEFIELAEGLQPGEHILACEVQSETTSGGWRWRVQGIASQ
ncbi:hypothetical protein JCM10213v2_005909 [Rhodosporidiobolus nylandii]